MPTYHYTGCIKRNGMVEYLERIAFRKKCLIQKFSGFKRLMLQCNRELGPGLSFGGMGPKLIFSNSNPYFSFQILIPRDA